MRCDVIICDQNRFLDFADIFDRIAHMSMFFMRDIFDVIHLLHISLFEDINYFFQSFIDTLMRRCRDSEGIRDEEFLRDLGSDFMGLEKIKDLFSELSLVFFEDIWIIYEIIFIDEKQHPFFDDYLSFFVDI